MISNLQSSRFITDKRGEQGRLSKFTSIRDWSLSMAWGGGAAVNLNQ